MLRFLGKTTGSAKMTGGSSLVQVRGGGDEGLSTWELVNATQSDDEDLFSFGSDEEVSVADAVSGDDLEPVLTEDEDDDVDAPAPRDFVSAGDMIAIQAMSVSPPMTFPVVMARELVAHDDVDVENEEEEEEEEDDDDDVGDDYDDELVPWKLKGRFEKQRMTKMGVRKMGERGGPKLKANKLPYYLNKKGGFSHVKLR